MCELINTSCYFYVFKQFKKSGFKLYENNFDELGWIIFGLSLKMF